MKPNDKLAALAHAEKVTAALNRQLAPPRASRVTVTALPDGLPWLLTLDEAARALRLSKRWTWHLIQAGELHARHTGRRLLIPRESLLAFVNALPAATPEAEGQ